VSTPPKAERLRSPDAADNRDGLRQRLLSLARGREGQSYTVELVRSPAEGRGVPANAETKHEAPVAEVIEIGGQPRNEDRRPVEHAGDHRTEPYAIRGAR
jgi:hypothetical protein